MTPSRRSVLAGVGLAAAGVGVHGLRRRTAAEGGEIDQSTLRAVVGAIAPKEVDAATVDDVARRHAEGLSADEECGLAWALGAVDRAARRRFGTGFAALDREERRRLLRSTGVTQVGADPGSTVAGRVRNYLFDAVAYTLATDPQVTRTVGIENPHGHPGGFGGGP